MLTNKRERGSEAENARGRTGTGLEKAHNIN
jgi:hypothetical protein